MAFDLSLATAKKAAKAVGAIPPANYPGGEEKWYVDWFTDGVNQGDARLIKFADPNATISSGETFGHNQANDLIADYQNAAPSSEWMGKRKPTARELRRYAVVEQNGNYLGEDFGRVPDRILAKYIKTGWDVNKGGFFTADGTQVAKPSDQHKGSWVAGWEPGGEFSDRNGGGGAGGGGGAAGGGGGRGGDKGEAPAVTTGRQGQLSLTGNPLQDALIRQFNGQGGIMGANNPFGESSNMGATALRNGGLMWGENQIEALKNKTNAQGQIPGQATPATTTPPASTNAQPNATATLPGATTNANGALPGSTGATSNSAGPLQNVLAGQQNQNTPMPGQTPAGQGPLADVLQPPRSPLSAVLRRQYGGQPFRSNYWM